MLTCLAHPSYRQSMCFWSLCFSCWFTYACGPSLCRSCRAVLPRLSFEPSPLPTWDLTTARKESLFTWQSEERCLMWHPAGIFTALAGHTKTLPEETPAEDSPAVALTRTCWPKTYKARWTPWMGSLMKNWKLWRTGSLDFWKNIWWLGSWWPWELEYNSTKRGKLARARRYSMWPKGMIFKVSLVFSVHLHDRYDQITTYELASSI